jgi:GST-like protein
MIDVYYWPTPNGKKIALMLEEIELPYTIHPINITKGEQHSPEFLG